MRHVACCMFFWVVLLFWLCGDVGRSVRSRSAIEPPNVCSFREGETTHGRSRRGLVGRRGCGSAELRSGGCSSRWARPAQTSRGRWRSRLIRRCQDLDVWRAQRNHFLAWCAGTFAPESVLRFRSGPAGRVAAGLHALDSGLARGSQRPRRAESDARERRKIEACRGILWRRLSSHSASPVVCAVRQNTRVNHLAGTRVDVAMFLFGRRGRGHGAAVPGAGAPQI